MRNRSLIFFVIGILISSCVENEILKVSKSIEENTKRADRISDELSKKLFRNDTIKSDYSFKPEKNLIQKDSHLVEVMKAAK